MHHSQPDSGPPRATGDPGTNTVLIMTSSLRTSQLLSEFLSSMDPDAAQGSEGRKMMEDKLRLFLWWKARLGERKPDGKSGAESSGFRSGRGAASAGYGSATAGEGELSEALKRKDRERQARAANRRRVRGGAPVPSVRDGQPSNPEGPNAAPAPSGSGQSRDEAISIDEL